VRQRRALCSASALTLALVCLIPAVAIAPVGAQEPTPSNTLQPGKGSDLTMARCVICHDITHITRSRLSRDEWDDNIKVMIARGMPIEPQEIPVIVEYLSTYYNREQPPPASEPAPVATAAGASSIDRLLADNGCMACHAVDKRLVGPTFREVSAKYKNDGGAAVYLARKVKEGGAGAWGPVPMPPHPQISDGDVARLARWVLEH